MRSPRERDVAVVPVSPGGYPAAPFDPSEAYPELGVAPQPDCPNGVFAAVRELFRHMRLDVEHYSTPAWNPLGEIVRPGDTVLIKPNLVREFRETHAGHEDCLVTHASVLRAVAEYARKALNGRGRLIIADAPHNDADFSGVCRVSGLDALERHFAASSGLAIEVRDLRREAARKIDGVIVEHQALRGDPEGYVLVDLGSTSFFAEVPQRCAQLYGSEYDTSEIVRHHRDGRHAYLIAGTALKADVVISVPKLKTHKKVGITCNLKNLVGINGNKNLLPHYCRGPVSQGGDAHPRDSWRTQLEHHALAQFRRWFPRLGGARRHLAGPLKALGKAVFGDTNGQTVRSGNWHGNDTCWRMVLDLNRILIYADAAGKIHDRPQRRFLSVTDAVVAGEGDGPLNPTPRALNLLLGGFNPAAVDCVCAQVAGFDPARMQMIARAFGQDSHSIACFSAGEITIRSNVAAWCGPVDALPAINPPLRPHFGWAGAVERRKTARPTSGATGAMGAIA